MSRSRAYLTLGLLAFGILLGIVAQRVTATGVKATEYATLPTVGEPAAAAAIAAAIMGDDPKALGSQLEPQTLTRLGRGLAPIANVRTVKFVGATDLDGHTIAAYIATGRDARGVDVIVGFTLHVEQNAVVGVN